MGVSGTTKKIRFYEIDLLRFLAAFSVLLFHYTYKGWKSDDISHVSFIELGHFFKYGYLGVHLFFIISGFVILMTAINKDIRGFTISRITRLYPAYWLAVSLTTIVSLWIGENRYPVDIKQYLINLTMMHRFIDVRSIDGVYWSLIVELKFYFLIFMLILIRQIKNIHWYLGLWLAASIFIFHYGHIHIIGALLFPQWSSYFIAGAIFYLIRLQGISSYKILLLIGAYYLSLETLYVEFNSIFSTVSKQVERYYIAAGLVTFFYMIFLGISLNMTKFMNKQKFVLLGALTYPLYLIHQNIGFMLFNSLHEYANKYVLLFGISSFMLLVAYLIHTQIEKQFAPILKNALIKTTNFIKIRKS